MPICLCPCCGGVYMVPMAICESELQRREREEGWSGTIVPAKCGNCFGSLGVGDAAFIRGGHGITFNGSVRSLAVGTPIRVLAVSAWEEHGSIYRVALPSADEVYVARSQIGTEPEARYFAAEPLDGVSPRGDGTSARRWWQFWKRKIT
jgi:hypothetical protein